MTEDRKVIGYALENDTLKFSGRGDTVQIVSTDIGSQAVAFLFDNRNGKIVKHGIASAIFEYANELAKTTGKKKNKHSLFEYDLFMAPITPQTIVDLNAILGNTRSVRGSVFDVRQFN